MTKISPAIRRLAAVGLAAGTLLVVPGLALADSAPSGTTEGHESAPHACPTNGTAPNPAYDDAGDCANGESTYTVWEYDNQVHCTNAPDLASTPFVSFGAGPYPRQGQRFVEVCSDSTWSPVNGRVIVAGSTSDGSLDVAVDGDKDDPIGSGWVGVHVDADGSTVACGDASGNQDSQSPTEADTLDDCAAP